MPRAFRVVLVILAALGVSLPALSQTRDPATAEALFQAAKSAFEAGRYAEACQKFAESQRLDPGAGTLINLAACREKTHELALAWEAWQEALRSLTNDDERRPEVQRRAKALEGRVPHLTVELAPGAPPDSHVSRDGIELGQAALGVPIPVDPGKHVIEVTASGRQKKSFEIDLAESKSEKLTVEPGEALPPETPPPAAKPVVSPKPIAPAPKPEADRGRGNNTKTLGYVIGGIGVAGIAVGGVTGLLALGRKHTMDDDCVARNGTQFCGQAGIDAAHSGKTLATVSTLSFAAGALAVGVGAYFVLSSSEESTTALSAHALPGGGAFGFRRTF